MDGPVIQEAALRALQRGTVPDQVLDGIARTEAPVPIAVMTYYMHVGISRQFDNDTTPAAAHDNPERSAPGALTAQAGPGR